MGAPLVNADSGHEWHFTLSLDGVVHAIGAVFKFFSGLVHPVSKYVSEVAASGWIGAAIVFGIFFTLFLVRTGGAVKDTAFFAAVMEYIGTRALVVCGVYAMTLCAEYVLMPILVIVVRTSINTVTGGSPGLFETLGFIFGSSTQYKSSFWNDMSGYYQADRHVMPVGFHAMIFVFVAFGSMYLVGKALEKLQQAREG